MDKFIVTVCKSLNFELIVDAEDIEEIEDFMEDDLFLRVDHLGDEANSVDYEIIDVEEVMEEDD